MFILVLLFGVIKILEYFGIMPASLMKGDPNYSTVLLSNLGSIGAGAPYHHLSNYGTCSIMITIGTMRKEKRIMDDGTEQEVKFRDRYSRLIYIYTLMHPKGYRSAFLKNDNLKGLCDLYSTLYFASAEPLMQYTGDKFKQLIYQSVAQSRVFIRNTDPHAKEFEIGNPRKYNGRTLVPAAADADKVIIDNSLKY